MSDLCLEVHGDEESVPLVDLGGASRSSIPAPAEEMSTTRQSRKRGSGSSATR